MTNIITGRQIAIGSGSTSTSGAWFVGNFRLLTVSVVSGTSLSAATVIIQGSNADGFGQVSGDLGGPTSMTGWSNITAILPGSLNLGGNVGSGIFTFDPPGYRWVRSTCSPGSVSAASVTTVIFTGVSF